FASSPVLSISCLHLPPSLATPSPSPRFIFFFFFFNDPATTEIYTLSLHDALPIFDHGGDQRRRFHEDAQIVSGHRQAARLGKRRDRKSTRLNSSHVAISYAVFCLKKKKKSKETRRARKKA